MPDLRKRKLTLLRKRAPKPVPPTGIQVSYYAELKRMVAYARKLVEKRLLPVLPDLLGRAAAQRGDSISQAVHLDAEGGNPQRRVNKIIRGMESALSKAFPHDRLEALAERVAEATSEHQKAELLRQVKSTVGVDLKNIADRKLRPRVKQFAAENVALIKTIPQQLFADVEKRVLSGMRQGLRHEELAEQLQERFGVSESRAKLIARDQVLKFNGELNKVRQQDLGVTRFVWRTVHDNRVREVHSERDGKTYSWDDPPGDESDPGDGSFPGEGINCRCWSEPVISDLVDE